MSESATSTTKSGDPVYWHDAEPARLRRDLTEVAAFAPYMAFTAGPGADEGVVHHGVWVGRLPVWPFDRPMPMGLDDLVPDGLRCAVWCSPAHPMLPPQVVPLEPEPEIVERSQHTWHVSPGGSLCLMQTLGAWEPNDSIVDLLIKACGWRVEYALMKAGVVETMTVLGIVNDGSLDHLISEAVTVKSQVLPDEEPSGLAAEGHDADTQPNQGGEAVGGPNLEASS